MARNDLGQLSARVGLDTTEFERNIAMMKRELKLSRQEFINAGKGIHGFGQDISNTSAQMNIVENNMATLSKQLDVHKSKYAEASKGADGYSKAMQDQAYNIAKTQHELKLAQEQYAKLYIQMRNETDPFAKFVNSADNFFKKTKDVGKKMEAIGRTWTRVGVAVGGATGLVVKSFIDWESAYATMAKTVDGTPMELDAIAQDFRDLSMEIPVASSELMELAGIAGQLDIKQDAIVGFTKVMADMGATTVLSSEEAATTLAQFANIIGMSQDNFDRLGSSIVHVGKFVARLYRNIQYELGKIGENYVVFTSL